LRPDRHRDLLVLTALFAPWLAPHDPNWQDAAARLQGPARHWLGTDSYGRDLLSRLIYGARPALGWWRWSPPLPCPPGCWWGSCPATMAAGWSAY
jgi:peptide/nickel transport system permease protein